MSKIIFSNALFGYDKNQVMSYVRKLQLEHQQELSKKEDEIEALKVEIEKANERIEELQEKLDDIYNNKGKISDVLLEIQQKADTLEKETIKKCEERKEELDKQISKKIEDLKNIKSDVNGLKNDLICVLEKYKSQMDLLDNFEINDAN